VNSERKPAFGLYRLPILMFYDHRLWRRRSPAESDTDHRSPCFRWESFPDPYALSLPGKSAGDHRGPTNGVPVAERARESGATKYVGPRAGRSWTPSRTRLRRGDDQDEMHPARCLAEVDERRVWPLGSPFVVNAEGAEPRIPADSGPIGRAEAGPTTRRRLSHTACPPPFTPRRKCRAKAPCKCGLGQRTVRRHSHGADS